MREMTTWLVGLSRFRPGFGRRVWAGTITLVATVAVVASPSTSMAAGDNYMDLCLSNSVSCQTGVRVSGTGGTADTCGTGYGSTRICIDYDGDYVFVYDGEADGGSGLAEIYSSSGSYDFRYCRNAHGAGTWARCNFDWPEDATKRVYGGVRYSYTNHPTSSELWHFTGA